MNGFEVYKLYQALKFHFEDGKYDFFKYNGQVKANETVYKTKKDRWNYEKVAKKYGEESMHFLLSNIISDSKFWIGNAMKEESSKKYLTWRKVYDRMEFTFESDLKELENICNEVELQDLYLIFFVRKEQPKQPFVLRAVLADHISLETFCVLDKIFDFESRWEELCKRDPIARKTLLKAKKYTPFLHIGDTSEYEKLIGKFAENIEENRLNYSKLT